MLKIKRAPSTILQRKVILIENGNEKIGLPRCTPLVISNVLVIWIFINSTVVRLEYYLDKKFRNTARRALFVVLAKEKGNFSGHRLLQCRDSEALFSSNALCFKTWHHASVRCFTWWCDSDRTQFVASLYRYPARVWVCCSIHCSRLFPSTSVRAMGEQLSTLYDKPFLYISTTIDLFGL